MTVVEIPLINAGEDEIEVRVVAVEEGDRVEAGELICVIESTKAAMELEAPVAGYVRALRVTEGRRARVGQPVCALTQTADEPVRLDADPVSENLRGETAVASTLRARALAARNGIDLASLGVEGIVRARHVERALASGIGESWPSPPRAEGERGGDHMVLVGGGGHARALVDLIRVSRPDLHLIGALDDDPAAGDDVLGVPLIGPTARLAELRERGVVHAGLGVGAVRDNAVRVRLFHTLRALGFVLPSLVHPRAVIEASARLGRGNQIFAGAVVGANVRLGDNTLINSNAVLSHDCVVDSHSHVAPGALLAGGVRVGRNTVVGMGVTVYLGVRLGDDAVIPNGTHVFRDVDPGGRRQGRRIG